MAIRLGEGETRETTTGAEAGAAAAAAPRTRMFENGLTGSDCFTFVVG